MSKPRVLMIGADRGVMGGIPAVVNNYYATGLDKVVDLQYLSTMKDGSKIKKLFVAAAAYARFGRLLKNCDVLHVHMAAYASFDRKAIFVRRAHRAGKKIIIHQHGGDFKEYYFRDTDEKKHREIREVFAMADRIVVLSEEWAEFFGTYACDPAKIIVLHNGVIVPDYERQDYSDHDILMLGRLVAKKGAFDLLEAAPKVVKAFPDAVFYIGGDGELEKCRRIVAENGTEKNVIFTGWIKDKEKEEYLKKCSVNILPSYFEAMPISILEGMSYGMTTIATAVGGVPQIIEDGVNGILIEPGSVDVIADTLIDILTDEERKAALGRAGRETIVSRFDLKKQIDLLLDLYRELTA